MQILHAGGGSSSHSLTKSSFCRWHNPQKSLFTDSLDSTIIHHQQHNHNHNSFSNSDEIVRIASIFVSEGVKKVRPHSNYSNPTQERGGQKTALHLREVPFWGKNLWWGKHHTNNNKSTLMAVARNFGVRSSGPIVLDLWNQLRCSCSSIFMKALLQKPGQGHRERGHRVKVSELAGEWLFLQFHWPHSFDGLPRNSWEVTRCWHRIIVSFWQELYFGSNPYLQIDKVGKYHRPQGQWTILKFVYFWKCLSTLIIVQTRRWN